MADDHKYLAEMDEVILLGDGDLFYVAQNIGQDPLRKNARQTYSGIKADLELKLDKYTRGEVDVLVSGRVNWVFPYAVGPAYDKNDMVGDGDWTMIANKKTDDRAAPQPVGDRTFVLDEFPVWSDLSNVSGIHSGHRFNFTDNGWLTTIRVWIPAVSSTISYSVIIANVSDPSNIVSEVYVVPSPVVGEWNDIAVGSHVVLAGNEYVVYLDAINSASNTTVMGDWDFDGDSRTAPSAPGAWSRDRDDFVMIHKTDRDGTDRSAELGSFIPGTEIHFFEVGAPQNSRTYAVDGAAVDNGDYYSYPVDRTAREGSRLEDGDEITTMDATVPVASATKYVEEPNVFPLGSPRWADVTGYLEFDGVAQPGAENNAYGVDLEFQPAVVSPDWDFVALRLAGGGSGGGGDLTPHTLGFHSDTDLSPIVSGAVITWDGDQWIENPSFKIDNLRVKAIDPNGPELLNKHAVFEPTIIPNRTYPGHGLGSAVNEVPMYLNGVKEFNFYSAANRRGFDVAATTEGFPPPPGSGARLYNDGVDLYFVTDAGVRHKITTTIV